MNSSTGIPPQTGGQDKYRSEMEESFFKAKNVEMIQKKDKTMLLL